MLMRKFLLFCLFLVLPVSAFSGTTQLDINNATQGTLVSTRVAPINLGSSGNGGVTGNLQLANFASGVGASTSTFWRGDGSWSNQLVSLNLTGSLLFNGTALQCSNLTDCGNLVSLNGANIFTGSNSLSSAGSFDGRATLVPNGTILQAIVGAAPTLDGAAGNNTTNHTFVFGSNGGTLVAAVAATGAGGTGTACTAQFVSAVSGTAAPTCSTVLLNQLGAAGASSTLPNGNFPLVWNYAQTTNSQSAITFGETTAATGTSDTQVTISTLANSTASLLTLSQGAISTVFPASMVSLSQTNTGATNVPIFSVSATYNNASLTGSIFGISVVNTSSNLASTFLSFNGGTGGVTAEFIVDLLGDVKAAGNFESTAAGGTTSLLGGLGSGNTAGQVGGLFAHGSDNTNAGASAAGGVTILRGGALTTATPNAAALEGLTQIGDMYLKGAAIAAVGDLLCGTTTAWTLTDCPTTPGTNLIGVATSITNPIGIVGYGVALVKLDAAFTAIGDNVCLSTTTAGTGHDNGSASTACALGTSVGVIVATVGTIPTMSGSGTANVAMSTTLVAVQLHIQQ